MEMSIYGETPSRTATQKISQHFTESEGSLPCSLEPATVPILRSILSL
jgi:hypothetical protein